MQKKEHFSLALGQTLLIRMQPPPPHQNAVSSLDLLSKQWIFSLFSEFSPQKADGRRWRPEGPSERIENRTCRHTNHTGLTTAAVPAQLPAEETGGKNVDLVIYFNVKSSIPPCLQYLRAEQQRNHIVSK